MTTRRNRLSHVLQLALAASLGAAVAVLSLRSSEAAPDTTHLEQGPSTQSANPLRGIPMRDVWKLPPGMKLPVAGNGRKAVEIDQFPLSSIQPASSQEAR